MLHRKGTGLRAQFSHRGIARRPLEAGRPHLDQFVRRQRARRFGDDRR
ncbi:MAG: hypothetical protein O2975_07640 [Proteobacteria bacterium]|nr:hypothetical protein [Pseudomonadota bacterium]